MCYNYHCSHKSSSWLVLIAKSKVRTREVCSSRHLTMVQVSHAGTMCFWLNMDRANMKEPLPSSLLSFPVPPPLCNLHLTPEPAHTFIIVCQSSASSWRAGIVIYLSLSN
jgi:hypothetical protein